MQEIKHLFEDEVGIREQIDMLTAEESEQLNRVFGARRKAALEKAAELGGSVTIRETRRIGRNDPCPCGSGTKFKRCCGRRLAADDARVAE